MTIYNGNSKIANIYNGNQKIKEVYCGSDKVYSNPLYYCYKNNNGEYYYYYLEPFVSEGQVQDTYIVQYTFEQASSSSQLVNLVSFPTTCDSIESNGNFVGGTISFIRRSDLDLYT